MMVITDWRLPQQQVWGALEALAPLGPALCVQLRAPGAPARRLFDDGLRLRRLLERHDVPLFVNGRLDVALALDAHLHLPGHEASVAEVRPHLPTGRWISVAVHAGEAPRAEGADLALVSPVWPPGSKPGDNRPTLGPEGFARLAATLPCPALALGGVDATRARELPRMTGGIAVVGAVLNAPSPRRAAEALLTAFAGR